MWVYHTFGVIMLNHFKQKTVFYALNLEILNQTNGKHVIFAMELI